MDLSKLSDEALLRVTKEAILAAAQGEAAGGDERSYDKAMGVMAESNRRHRAAGHIERCCSGIYSQAFELVTAAHAGRIAEPPTCTCVPPR